MTDFNPHPHAPICKSLIRHMPWMQRVDADTLHPPKAVSARCTHPAGLFIFPQRCPMPATSTAFIRHRFPPTRIKSVRSLSISLVAPRPHPPRCFQWYRLLRTASPLNNTSRRPAIQKPKIFRRSLRKIFCIPL